MAYHVYTNVKEEYKDKYGARKFRVSGKEGFATREAALAYARKQDIQNRTNKVHAGRFNASTVQETQMRGPRNQGFGGFGMAAAPRARSKGLFGLFK